MLTNDRKPWWHYRRWPNGLRMFLLGIPPMADEEAIRRELAEAFPAAATAEQTLQTAVALVEQALSPDTSTAPLRESLGRWVASELQPPQVADYVAAMEEREIPNRRAELVRLNELAKSLLAALAFVFAGLIYGFTTKPGGTDVGLLLGSNTCIGLAMILLVRAVIPPPRSLWEEFESPLQWAMRSSTQDGSYVQTVSNLQSLNALVQFLKRLLVWGGIFTAFGLVLFVVFTYTTLL